MSELSLHEFILQNREEILSLSIASVQECSPDRNPRELAADFDLVLDEVVEALSVERESPAHKSEAAARVGAQHQHQAYEIEKLPLHFGSIPEAVGELGARQNLCFSAREYKIFNHCIDTLISSALEQYSSEAWQEHEHQTTQRIACFVHELRNALGSARMAFAILKRGELGINSKTGDVLERSLGRLENLVGQALVAIHLHAGLDLALTRLRVLRLLHDMADTAVVERGICVKVCADEALEVDADERLLVSAVSNLLQNAIKFTKSGGQVMLRARRAGGSVAIEVEDECGGLPPGKKDELFEPYVRCGDDKRGLGLGLAIAREAVEAHGGMLSVQNLPGKGCVFTLELTAPNV